MGEKILIHGSSPAALQAARNLADSGVSVILIEREPFLKGLGTPVQLSYLDNTEILEILKHPRIQTYTNSEICQLKQREDQSWDLKLTHHPRYVDLARCTACGDCIEVCPVSIPGTDHKAIHFGGQPDCAVITKMGISPCSDACPAGIHVQGYVALIKQGNYQEAYQLIMDGLPFPSVCGRVCNHPCEEACRRSQMDDPLNLMGLKRFVADWSFVHRHDQGETGSQLPKTDVSGKSVAVIGAGPAGLTAARDLIRLGHTVDVYDDNPAAGGMMRVGIPPHRMSYEQLDWEINLILQEGVKLHLETRIDDIPGLLNEGFDAVLLATGANQAVKVGLANADHPDNWLSLEFLKKVCLGEGPDLTGRKVVVLGGGDVAMDAARAAVRLGGPEVRILCRGLRASEAEIQQAEEEGIEIIRDRVFKEIILEGKAIAGVECVKADVGEVIDGRRQFTENAGTEHLISGDLVIWAVGQRSDLSYLPADSALIGQDSRKLQVDSNMMTSLDGVFAAGDVRIGMTSFVVDAVNEGHLAAAAIDDYLMERIRPDRLADRPVVLLSPEEMQARMEGRKAARVTRKSIPQLPVSSRIGNFDEVDQVLLEEDARQESERCLACGPCSECLACVEVCEPEAILHQQLAEQMELHAAQIVSSAGIEGLLTDPGMITIPGENALSGSAAVYEILQNINRDRSLLTASKRSSSEQGGETGLVLCQCGGQISGAVDTSRLREQTAHWPEVSRALEVPFSCTPEGAESIQSWIAEHKLQRLILAACSCCELDQVCYSCSYQRVRCKENLGVFTALENQADLVFVNIRESCASVHPRDKEKATRAAELLIRSALFRQPSSIPEFRSIQDAPAQVLVVGEGPSGRSCLNSLEGLGLTGKLIPVLESEVIRSGGRYQVEIDGTLIVGEGLVLTPGSGAELDFITSAVRLINGHYLLQGDMSASLHQELGIAICSPELKPEVAGKGAAVQLAAWFQRIADKRLPAARVDPLRCRTCGTCQEVCGLGIPAVFRDQGGDQARIDPRLCQNCGTCAAHCPSGAIIPGTDTDLELERILNEVLA